LFALKSLCQASQDEAAAGPGDPRPRPPPAPPGAGDALGYGSRLFRKATQRMAGRLRERVGKARDHWHLEAGTGGIDGFDPALAAALPRLCHTMADPFLLEHE